MLTLCLRLNIPDVSGMINKNKWTKQTLFDLQKYKDAVAAFDRAIELNPQNLMARYKKATTLIAIMEQQQLSARTFTADVAIVELEQLRDLLPREALIFFQLGKIYKKLKNKEKALHYFMTALNLPHKDDPVTKEEISKLLNDEDDEDDDVQDDHLQPHQLQNSETHKPHDEEAMWIPITNDN